MILCATIWKDIISIACVELIVFVGENDRIRASKSDLLGFRETVTPKTGEIALREQNAALILDRLSKLGSKLDTTSVKLGNRYAMPENPGIPSVSLPDFLVTDVRYFTYLRARSIRPGKVLRSARRDRSRRVMERQPQRVRSDRAREPFVRHGSDRRTQRRIPPSPAGR